MFSKKLKITGTAAEGIGGPHKGNHPDNPENPDSYYPDNLDNPDNPDNFYKGNGYVWHLSILMRGLTSSDDQEISDVLTTLENTHADRFFMHEGFLKDDASHFSRPWFAWANSLYGIVLCID